MRRTPVIAVTILFAIAASACGGSSSSTKHHAPPKLDDVETRLDLADVITTAIEGKYVPHLVKASDRALKQAIKEENDSFVDYQEAIPLDELMRVAQHAVDSSKFRGITLEPAGAEVGYNIDPGQDATPVPCTSKRSSGTHVTVWFVRARGDYSEKPIATSLISVGVLHGGTVIIGRTYTGSGHHDYVGGATDCTKLGATSIKTDANRMEEAIGTDWRAPKAWVDNATRTLAIYHRALPTLRREGMVGERVRTTKGVQAFRAAMEQAAKAEGLPVRDYHPYGRYTVARLFCGDISQDTFVIGSNGGDPNAVAFGIWEPAKGLAPMWYYVSTDAPQRPPIDRDGFPNTDWNHTDAAVNAVQDGDVCERDELVAERNDIYGNPPKVSPAT